MEKRKNCWVIPTDKPSSLWIDNDTQELVYGVLSIDNIHNCKNHNIYITNDEEIKEGDYFWKPDCNMIFKAEYTPYKGCQKIILTTDQDLIKDGVQAIDDEFLEWFVKNSSCEEVEAYWYKGIEVGHYYKIIIPQEEPKQECEHIKKYGCIKDICTCNKGRKQRLEKYSERFDNKDNELVEGVFNPENWGKRMVEEPKQETVQKFIEQHCITEQQLIDGYKQGLELIFEKASKITKQETTLEEAINKFVRTMLLDQSVYIDFLQCAEFGAKWQQEQDNKLYSEEEVEYLLYSLKNYLGFGDEVSEKEWFEQFKKK
jgi:hypothetical protein